MSKYRVIWIILLVALLGFGLNAALSKKSIAPPSSIVTASAIPTMLEFLPSDAIEIQPQELKKILPLSGSLRAVNQSIVKAKVPGEIKEVLVREGEAIQAGQVLIKMDASEYQARVEQAKGALSAARGQLEMATKTRNNNQILLAQEFISKNAYDNAASQYDIALANVDSAKGTLDVAQKALSDTIIRAPLSGLISIRSVHPGEKVSADNRLLEIVDLRQLEMEAAVPGNDIANINIGQEVEVKVEGLTTAINGKVIRINPSIQSGSRSILIYISINNPQGILRAGMFGEAQLTLAKKSGILTLPTSAIQQVGNQTVVYAFENGKLAKKPVTLGIRGKSRGQDAIEILSGLNAGSRIISNNLGALQDGASIKFIPVQSNEPSNASSAAPIKNP